MLFLKAEHDKKKKIKRELSFRTAQTIWIS